MNKVSRCFPVIIAGCALAVALSACGKRGGRGGMPPMAV